MANEQQVQFNSNGRVLRGILHTPDGGRHQRGAFVFCPPFAEERKCAHRVLVRCARRLCEMGFGVLRFDLSGTGESDGDAAEGTPARWRSDARNALNFASEATGAASLGLLGLRLGASLALQAAAGRDDVEWLILWEPVVDGRRYLQLNLRRSVIKKMLTQGEQFDAKAAAAGCEEGPQDTDFDGHLVSAACQEQIGQINLTTTEALRARSTFLLHIGPRETLSKEGERLLSHLQSLGATVTGQAVREKPFWNLIGLVDGEAAIHATADWVKNTAAQEEADDQGVSVRPASGGGWTSSPKPITFASAGRKLFGMLHLPEGNGPHDAGVIFLHGWAGNRRGPHDMLVEAADACAARGIAALRFDFRGRGDSEGGIFDANLATMIEDTRAAADCIRDEAAIERVALVGICSGCEVAIGAAPLILGVEELALWSAPMVGASREATRRRKRLANLAEYGRKLFRLETWRKAFTGQLNVELIKRAATGKGGAGETPTEGGDGEQAAPQPDIPWRERFEACPRRLLFVYGGSDPVTPDAKAHYRRLSQEAGHDARFHVVDGANHSYFSLAWKREVIEATLDWLGEKQLAGERKERAR